MDRLEEGEMARTESEIFDELAKLCVKPGFIHVLSYLNVADNVIMYDGEIDFEDVERQREGRYFIRTEQNVLLGLLVKNNIDFSIPTPQDFDAMGGEAIALMKELHEAMMSGLLSTIEAAHGPDAGTDVMSSGAYMREAIFYAGESAFSSQYRDFLPSKYGRDDAWLVANKGFDSSKGKAILLAIREIGECKFSEVIEYMRKLPPEQTTTLPMFEFTADEVAGRSGLTKEEAMRILEAFELPAWDRNVDYKNIQDFNHIAAYPLIRHGDAYILFNMYSLAESLYQSPFYWMWDDKPYRPTAMAHRGQFTEELAYGKLVAVFGKGNVHMNVVLSRSKGVTDGEIDVLVFYAGRAIVVQAKSKQLTIAARQGDDGKLREDFTKAVQDSCDQGFSCAELLFDPALKLYGADGAEIAKPSYLKKFYVLCVVADHYPALSFQSRQFLQAAPSDRIAPPFVMDVFMLDAMVEMLDSPLHLMAYIERRTSYDDVLLASHELTILGFHINHNLWIDGGHDMVVMHDDLANELEIAMMVRRDNYSGLKTPVGMLAKFGQTPLGKLALMLGVANDASMLDLGMIFLTFGERTVRNVSAAIDRLAGLARSDGKHHDFVMPLGEDDAGFTVHINADSDDIARKRLASYCLKRKYAQKARHWFGLCLNPTDCSPRFAVEYDFEWAQDFAMDEESKGLKEPVSFDSPRMRKAANLPKVGRNDPCPCESGKKYKKCCGVSGT